MKRGHDRGFSLVELLVALAISGGIAAVMVTTLTRQQRFYSSAATILDTRAQLRDAGDILATDLRGASISLGVPVMTDSAVELFTTVGSSIVCTANAGTYGLPPSSLASGANLSSLLVLPDTGDLALFYLADSSPDSARWETRRITGFSTRSVATACPASSGFTRAGDSGNAAYDFTVAPVPSANPRIGAPIHFVRRARYSLYRSSDAKWYLGYRRCAATGPSLCAAIQPVAGPYDAYSGNQSGVEFRYFDDDGVELPAGSATTTLSRIDVVVRGFSAKQVGLNGNPGPRYRDSVLISVALRNRAQ